MLTGLGAEKLKERMEKITIVNDIIDVGNATRVAAWRSQALREPKVIQDAYANFDIMKDKFAALRKITRPRMILNGSIIPNRRLHDYKQAMVTFLDLWLKNVDLARNEVKSVT